LFKNYNDNFKINKFSKFKKNYLNYNKEISKKDNKNYLKKILNKRFNLLILFQFYINKNLIEFNHKIKIFNKEIFLKYSVKYFNYKYSNKYKNFNKIFLNKFYY
jgi:hypothetical protein